MTSGPSSPGRVGVYPGSFNPPTAAHLEISRAALEQRDLDLVVWSVSQVALAKEDVDRPRMVDRIAVLRAVAAEHDWLEVSVTELQLLVDIAEGYDVLIMGADKWHQIQDPVFYEGDPTKRDAAMAALPALAVAPRPPLEVPAVHLLDVPEWAGSVSSTRARNGEVDLMLAPAAAFDRATGAWTDPDRYERQLRNDR